MTPPVEPLTMRERLESEMRRRAHLEACDDSHGWLAARCAFAEIDALRALVAAQAEVIACADAMRPHVSMLGVNGTAAAVHYDAARAALVKP